MMDDVIVGLIHFPNGITLKQVVATGRTWELDKTMSTGTRRMDGSSMWTKTIPRVPSIGHHQVSGSRVSASGSQRNASPIQGAGPRARARSNEDAPGTKHGACRHLASLRRNTRVAKLARANQQDKNKIATIKHPKAR